MLLNQCLAISLSPITGNVTSSQNKTGHHEKQVDDKEQADGLTTSLSVANNDSGQDSSDTGQICNSVQTSATSYCANQINQSSALHLYEQLVVRNCSKSSRRNNCSSEKEKKKKKKGEEEDEEQADDDVVVKLRRVFERVEFAGFVVPSWLLLSGTYDDLNFIKTTWTSGKLRGPPDLRIETLGKF